VDALCDSEDVIIAGIMQHIEEAGIHSGDSSCVLPAVSIRPETLETAAHYTRKLALALNVVGLVNLQFGIQRDAEGQDHVYVIEVNRAPLGPCLSLEGYRHSARQSRLAADDGPQTARSAPSPACQRPGLGTGTHFYVKSPVFPWSKFAGSIRY